MADSDDDWRVTHSVSQPQAGQAQPSSSLRQVEEDIRRQVGQDIGVGAGEAQIFLYAGAETAAGKAERIARDVLVQHGIAAESAMHRWHPIEERWETPDVPMPQTAAERQAERAGRSRPPDHGPPPPYLTPRPPAWSATPRNPVSLSLPR